ncbi:putative reverse transcriptase domain-containing protein, partial [Tanacetum coccineum]
ATKGDAGGAGGPAGRAGGPARAPAVRKCTFAGFMKCNPVTFHGKEGAVELCRWFKKTKMVFSISECTKGKKVKFAATTLHAKEIQRMKHEMWNLIVKDYNISAYTQHFNELALLCPTMVPTECKKIEAYIRGLSENIKGDVTSSKPANLNEAIRIAHALSEQRVQARSERVAEGNKRKWVSIQGVNINNCNNYKDNTHHNQQNNRR